MANGFFVASITNQSIKRWMSRDTRIWFHKSTTCVDDRQGINPFSERLRSMCLALMFMITFCLSFSLLFNIFIFAFVILLDLTFSPSISSPLVDLCGMDCASLTLYRWYFFQVYWNVVGNAIEVEILSDVVYVGIVWSMRERSWGWKLFGMNFVMLFEVNCKEKCEWFVSNFLSQFVLHMIWTKQKLNIVTWFNIKWEWKKDFIILNIGSKEQFFWNCYSKTMLNYPDTILGICMC